MKQKIMSILILACSTWLLSGCSLVVTQIDSVPDLKEEITEMPAETEAQAAETTEQSAETEQETEAPAESETEVLSVEADGWYTAPEDVAEYIYIYGELPENFITKNDAKDLGWVSSEGNLWDVAPGMSIGGDYFGNYEGLLPEGDYRECDVNYEGGYRGSERIIYGEDGSIYYTSDHYESFTQLY